MADIIELPTSLTPQHREHYYEQVYRQLQLLMQHPDFEQASLVHQSTHMIEMSLPKENNAFIRDLRVQIRPQPTSLKVCMIPLDYSGLDYMRAKTHRMRLQLAVLLRAVNNRLPPEQGFVVEPCNGTLSYAFSLSWADYQARLSESNSLRRLLKYLLIQLNTYAEVILFCEPHAHQTQPGSPFAHPHPELQTVNRYRFLLKNTRRFRESGMRYFESILQIKEHLKQEPNNSQLLSILEQTRCMFQGNIETYQQISHGLEEEETDKTMQKSLSHVLKNARGEQSRTPQRVVHGIKIRKSADIRSLSKEGAHSDIMRGKYVFEVIKTINQSTFASSKRWEGKEVKGELVVKSCNSKEVSSVNSFYNELHLLNYLKETKSSYLAKYYLEIKHFRERTDKDLIFMRPYAHNLYSVVRRSLSFSLFQRLSTSYKLAKGLCFLGHWGVLHRDFKPHNIMVDSHFNPFLIDFGSCAPMTGNTAFKVHQQRLLTTKQFHVYYHELTGDYEILQQKYTRSQYNKHPLFDVYSFGRVLTFLFFNSMQPPQPEELLDHPYPELLKNILFIINACLQVDPDDRPAFAEIASFLGTLDGFVKTLSRDLEMKNRSPSQSKETETTEQISQ